jgi:hypothetical protein
MLGGGRFAFPRPQKIEHQGVRIVESKLIQCADRMLVIKVGIIAVVTTAQVSP